MPRTLAKSTPRPRNIGGSLFGSTPPDLSAGACTVRPLPEEDTHALVNAAGVELARHPNGWSCQVLGERLAGEGHGSAREQAIYILDCGGSITAEGWRAVGGAPYTRPR
jgi:hypothetical protein